MTILCCIYWKINLHIGRPRVFKPVLFKGQIHFKKLYQTILHLLPLCATCLLSPFSSAQYPHLTRLFSQNTHTFSCIHTHPCTPHTHIHTLPDSLDRFNYLENSPRMVLCYYNSGVERGKRDFNFFPRGDWTLCPQLWSHSMNLVEGFLWERIHMRVFVCVCVFMGEMAALTVPYITLQSVYSRIIIAMPNLHSHFVFPISGWKKQPLS